MNWPPQDWMPLPDPPPVTDHARRRERGEMVCTRCGAFSSARICWNCTNAPAIDAQLAAARQQGAADERASIVELLEAYWRELDQNECHVACIAVRTSINRIQARGAAQPPSEESPT